GRDRGGRLRRPRAARARCLLARRARAAEARRPRSALAGAELPPSQTAGRTSPRTRPQLARTSPPLAAVRTRPGPRAGAVGAWRRTVEGSLRDDQCVAGHLRGPQIDSQRVDSAPKLSIAANDG